LNTFSLKLQTPRSISAILPISEPVGNGLRSPGFEQPRLLAGDEMFCTGTYSAGPTVLVAWGPNAAPPNGRPVRFAGTGGGAVTEIEPETSAASFVTAPTPITLGEIAGEIAVAVSGPALPFANTITTPASTALSAA
jgi:hypothetical protein